MRLSGTENRHKAIQNAPAEIASLALLVGQVAGGHIVRNLGVLRRVRGRRKMLDIFLAKALCGSRDFSNRFCEASWVPA